jgi:hypothetical protein
VFCLPAAEEGKPEPKKTVAADSVLSMARMFNSGHVPGSHLSDLKETGLATKRRSMTLMMGEKKLGMRGASQASLLDRANKARGRLDARP